MGCLASDRDGIMGGWSIAVIPCAATTCNITAVRPDHPILGKERTQDDGPSPSP